MNSKELFYENIKGESCEHPLNPLDLSLDKSSHNMTGAIQQRTFQPSHLPAFQQSCRRVYPSTVPQYPQKPYHRSQGRTTTALPKSPLASPSSEKSIGNIFRGQRQHLAQKWIGNHIVKKKSSFVVFWTILVAYERFCLGLNEAPVDSSTFYNLIHQQSLDDCNSIEDDEENQTKKIFFNLSFLENGIRNHLDRDDDIRGYDGKNVNIQEEVYIQCQQSKVSDTVEDLEDSDDSGIGTDREVHSEDDVEVPNVSRKSPNIQQTVAVAKHVQKPALKREISMDDQTPKDIILAKISALLSLEEFEQSPCIGEAKRLARLIVEMFEKNTVKPFLDVFSHSMSCRQCPNRMCIMFRQLFVVHLSKLSKANISGEGHDCALRKLYEHLLRLHLDYCNRDDCGLPNCHVLREKRRLAKSIGNKI